MVLSAKARRIRIFTRVQGTHKRDNGLAKESSQDI